MTCDVLVLGAGIVGAVIAKRLLDADGTRRITLIDAGLAGGGASQYSAGVHFPVGRSARVKALGEVGARYYSDLHAQEPALAIHQFDMQVSAARARAAEVESRCVGLQPLPRDDGQGHATWMLPGCHVSDVQQLAQWHVARIRPGAEVLEGLSVAAITEHRDGVSIALSCGQEIHAHALVLAPGPWANHTPLRRYTAPLGIRIKKVVALHINLPLDEAVPAYFPLEDAFLAPLPHRGHWLFSYTCPQWDVQPEDMRHCTIQAAEIEQARAVAYRVAPHIVPHIFSGRVFCDAYSPECEPIVRQLGAHGRIVFAGACNGSGYRLAPGIAAEVCALIL